MSDALVHAMLLLQVPTARPVDVQCGTAMLRGQAPEVLGCRRDSRQSRLVCTQTLLSAARC